MLFIGILQLPQEQANLVCLAPSLLHQTKRRIEADTTGLRIFEHATFERTALRWTVPVDATSAILAQGGAWLAKEGYGSLRARTFYRQTKRFHFLSIFIRTEPDIIEERPIAAQSASKAKLFTRIHAPPFFEGSPSSKPRLRNSEGSPARKILQDPENNYSSIKAGFRFAKKSAV